MSSLTLRPLLYGLLAMLSLIFAITSLWIIGAYHEFTRQARIASHAQIIETAIQQQLNLTHEPRALQLAQVGASLSEWPSSIAEMDQNAIETLLDDVIGQQLYTTGEIKLRGIALLDRNMRPLASRTVDDGADAEWQDWRGELAARRGLDRLRVVDRYVHDSDGGTVHVLVHPIGGVRLAGYLAVITEPTKALTGLTAFVHGRIIVTTLAGRRVLDEQPEDWPEELRAESPNPDHIQTAALTVRSAEGLPIYQVAVQFEDSYFAQKAARLREITYLITAIVAAVSLIAATLILHATVFQRVRAMSQALQRIVAGDTSVCLTEAGADEIGAMAGELRKVADHVNKVVSLKSELAAHRDHLEKLVRDRTSVIERQAADLERALDNERRLSALQRGFVSMASHEFRTPLSIIDGNAQAIERRFVKMPAQDVEARIRKIRSGVKRMIALMERMLAAARLESGKIDVAPVTMDIRALLTECCDAQMDCVASHKVVLELGDLPDEIIGDPDALTQVFTNLLSNAVKYSPGTNRVDVRGWHDGDDVVISVRDYGLGMDDDDQQQLFSRFFRAKTSAGIAGTGIGLNMVRLLVEEHAGLISVSSKEGQGSEFTVRLPRHGPGAQEKAVA
ncbi:MAG: ATP-binding protein [Alphaproteobacteria bacterium]